VVGKDQCGAVEMNGGAGLGSSRRYEKFAFGGLAGLCEKRMMRGARFGFSLPFFIPQLAEKGLK